LWKTSFHGLESRRAIASLSAVADEIVVVHDVLFAQPTITMPNEGSEAVLVKRLTAIVRGAPSLMQVLATARALDLPDWLIMSGAVYQRVLNALTKRAPDYGVRVRVEDPITGKGSAPARDKPAPREAPIIM
jgi:hypothetical protein